MRKLLIASVALLSIAICTAFVCIGYLFFTSSSQVSGTGSPSLGSIQTTTTPQSTKPLEQMKSPTPQPTSALASPTAGSGSTLDVLTSLITHPSDRIRLAQEYKGIDAVAATPVAPRQYKVGDKET